MPFKGTDKSAWAKAAKGRTPKQRSEIYYKEKSKNVAKNNKKSNANPELKTERYTGLQWDYANYYSRRDSRYARQSLRRESNKIHAKDEVTMLIEEKAIAKPNPASKQKSVINKEQQIKKSKPVKKKPEYKLSTSRSIFNNKLIDGAIKTVAKEVEDKIIDYCISKMPEETKKVIDGIKTVYDIMKIANSFYKIIRIYKSKLEKMEISVEKIEKNSQALKEYKTNYKSHRALYKNIENKSKYLLDTTELMVWSFDNDELFELVEKGKKTGTSSLYLNNHAKANTYSILENNDKSKRLLIKTIKVKKLKFKYATSQMARLEGEGNLSLDYWKAVHQEFFTAELSKEQKMFTEDILILFEEFKAIREL